MLRREGDMFFFFPAKVPEALTPGWVTLTHVFPTLLVLHQLSRASSSNNLCNSSQLVSSAAPASRRTLMITSGSTSLATLRITGAPSAAMVSSHWFGYAPSCLGDRPHNWFASWTAGGSMIGQGLGQRWTATAVLALQLEGWSKTWPAFSALDWKEGPASP